MFPSVFGHYS